MEIWEAFFLIIIGNEVKKFVLNRNILSDFLNRELRNNRRVVRNNKSIKVIT